MPYDIRKTKGGYALYHAGTDTLAVKKKYKTQGEALHVARARMYYGDKGKK
jgi:hypothetical protein